MSAHCTDSNETKDGQKESLYTDKEEYQEKVKEECQEKVEDVEEYIEEEEIGQEWWDHNWVWHHRSPYVTGELMDKLEPYIKKLETTPAWHAYDKYLRSIGPLTEELSLEARWKIAKEWYEREDPKAFWDKEYKQEEKNQSIKSSSKGWRRRYQQSINM